MRPLFASPRSCVERVARSAGLVRPVPTGLFRRRRSGSPRFLANPCTLAALTDPGSPCAPFPLRRTSVACNPTKGVGGFENHLSELNRAARVLAVYASRRTSPYVTQDSLASAGTASRAGLSPAGFDRVVSAHRILLAQASPGALVVEVEVVVEVVVGVVVEVVVEVVVGVVSRSPPSVPLRLHRTLAVFSVRPHSEWPGGSIATAQEQYARRLPRRACLLIL
jgi:hypothetical protein